ncbi:hypothetical protein EPD60_06175 [Flaviaesturariibacter flavus]|uniref:Uncharacterized protein n=1 Tax=Flaviaesturariibacter flavus TaxID=2502780 RepID=A0A4R1BK82_9BACT|nr:hypothetical protein [Flaviaesturariibacter flavus]TCJ17771.1 hypothetical protein EPD60_06175 [Flaviaesturariibacter flavus]
MLNNIALDVFIGLAFVFLLYSLLATILMEVIASFFNLRGALLVKAIRVMLEDRSPASLKSRTVIGRLVERSGARLREIYLHIACILPQDTLAKAFYKHPSVKYLSSSVARSKPSYIEPQNFATTLVRILRGRDFDGTLSPMQAIHRTLYPLDTGPTGRSATATVQVGVHDTLTATIQTDTLDQLRQLYIDAAGDVDRFRALLEQWFDETMARANGWYKRHTRNILFVVGFTIAIIGNVDTIKIFRVLSKDKTAREQMVQMAIQAQPALAPAVQHLKDSGRIATNAGSTPADLAADSMLRQTYTMLQDDAAAAGNVLGMGWHDSREWKQYAALRDSLAATKASLKKQPDEAALTARVAVLQSAITQLEPKVHDKFDWSTSLLGWIITGLALTLGAPFWFDLLNKLISIRSAGAKPKPAAKDDDDNAPAATPTAVNVTTVSTGPVPAAATAVGAQQPEFVTDEAFNQKIAQG